MEAIEINKQISSNESLLIPSEEDPFLKRNKEVKQRVNEAQDNIINNIMSETMELKEKYNILLDNADLNDNDIKSLANSIDKNFDSIEDIYNDDSIDINDKNDEARDTLDIIIDDINLLEAKKNEKLIPKDEINEEKIIEIIDKIESKELNEEVIDEVIDEVSNDNSPNPYKEYMNLAKQNKEYEEAERRRKNEEKKQGKAEPKPYELLRKTTKTIKDIEREREEKFKNNFKKELEKTILKPNEIKKEPIVKPIENNEEKIKNALKKTIEMIDYKYKKFLEETDIEKLPNKEEIKQIVKEETGQEFDKKYDEVIFDFNYDKSEKEIKEAENLKNFNDMLKDKKEQGLKEVQIKVNNINELNKQQRKQIILKIFSYSVIIIVFSATVVGGISLIIGIDKQDRYIRNPHIIKLYH